MKLLISSDIEGTCGIAAWSETDSDTGKDWYAYFQKQMTREVAAACEGAFTAGFTEVLVRDAHDTARNIIPTDLPKGAKLVRGWTGDQWSMVSGLQSGIDALAFTGYHAGAYTDGSPVSHSFSPSVDILLINGKPASEFTANSYAAGMVGVPVVFISGDSAVCTQAKDMIPQITTAPVLWGCGESTTSGHPDQAVEAIRQGMEEALAGNWQSCSVPMPASFEILVRYATHTKATFAAVYPGVERLDTKSVRYFSEDYMDVLRFFHFCV
ncbi:MAG: M55 family metallopeptidase [Peptococcaceae bacterium]|jgi:D-amino peptidase|nr:M55 family metallopeptidase [Peptococcaceae bacterium]